MTKYNARTVAALEKNFSMKKDGINSYPTEIRFPIEKIGKQVPKMVAAIFRNMYGLDKDLVVKSIGGAHLNVDDFPTDANLFNDMFSATSSKGVIALKFYLLSTQNFWDLKMANMALF